MLTYEVNLEVDTAIATEYRAWLRDHIQQMLALPGFVSAACFDVVDPAPSEGQVAWCVQYQVRDEAALEAYFNEHAATMRGDGLARFGTRFRASRRVLSRSPQPLL